MDKFIKFQNLARKAEDEAAEFYNRGNQAAGTRARKALQEIKELAQEIRLDIQEKKNERN